MVDKAWALWEKQLDKPSKDNKHGFYGFVEQKDREDVFCYDDGQTGNKEVWPGTLAVKSRHYSLGGSFATVG
jgi:hypothetical protein